MSARDRHNQLAPELVKALIGGASNEVEAFILLESVILGVVLFYRPHPRHAAEFLDTMTERVIDRMGS